ncbi:asparagine synthase-related protein [Blastomonas fulva]|uniref:asparagine synthase (glutamine-hydrolyzing) n=1 Tax=Blastomonas fulva TaxID=1550728 RepID=A0ABN5AZW0_9SPHN|nr:asparagine synthetase B family protein [Blastomonas fulva]ASR50313.1 hypothetical protein B5J99_01540 [Blastomonas fulva]
MAGRFIIDINPGASSQVRSVSDMGEPSFNNPAVRVWSHLPVIRIGSTGCIIGHLFSQTSPSRRVLEFDTETARAIEASNGRMLLKEFWGAYVAVVAGPDGAVSVLRDPSGLLPCYYRTRADGAVLAGDVADLASRGAGAVNLTEIGRLLASPDAMGRNTCLSGVSELLAGECLNSSPARNTLHEWWSPWEWTCPETPPKFDDAAARLRKVAFDCGGAWASCFHSILIGVSGGLDSSIVACCAHPGAAALHCVNFVSSGAGGDERRYASVLTDALGLRLHERHFDIGSVVIEQPAAPTHPWPNAAYFLQAMQATHSAFRDDQPVDAYFSGNGGDNVFCSLRTAAPFVDRFMSQGSRSGIMNTLRDIGVLTGADGMTILRHAWDIYRKAGSPPRTLCDTLGLSSSFFEAMAPQQPLHPWLNPPQNALPGKIGHVKQLLRAHRSIELYPRQTYLTHIAPLMSQPVVELCLSIPTWLWVHGGANRAVARAAFGGIVPDELLRRTSKGGPSGFMRDIYLANRSKAEDFLRGGLLAQAGMLDLSILSQAQLPTAAGSQSARRILAICAAEAWAQWWTSSDGLKGGHGMK